MLSTLSRWLTVLTAAAFLALGAVLFFAPSWSARNFPWAVSPFLAMTMGAWYIGTAAYAGSAARHWRWSAAYGLLLYVWAFGLGQSLLLVIHSDVVHTSRTLAWPYIGVFAIASITAAVGIVDALRVRPRIDRTEPTVGRVQRVLGFAFAIVVFVLALPLLDGYDNPGSIWPGPLTLISAQGFAVFFLALAGSAATVILVGTREAILLYGNAGVVLSGMILIATFVYIDRFDFAKHPGGLLYVGLYVGVSAITIWQLILVRRQRSGPAVERASTA